VLRSGPYRDKESCQCLCAKLTLTAGDMFEGTGMTGSVYRYELK
jgi:hypothetical protein